MKLMLAALAVTLAIAVTAAVFAIWPAIADAPWEDDTPVAEETDRTGELLCEGALRFREEAMAQAGDLSPNNLREFLADAQREIDRYC
ncbi:MAG: hypothetical protein J4O04_07795 [Chloroflexi bacterium]|nr:hypothetical protein [Chloroflexota bacterium]